MQTFVAMGLRVIVKALILAVWAIIKIPGKIWKWSAVTGGAVVLLIIMLGTLITFNIPKFSIIQTFTDNLNRVTRENLTGIRVVHTYNAEEYQQDKFEPANNDVTKVNLFTNRLMPIIQPGMTLIISSLTLGIYWV